MTSFLVCTHFLVCLLLLISFSYWFLLFLFIYYILREENILSSFCLLSSEVCIISIYWHIIKSERSNLHCLKINQRWGFPGSPVAEISPSRAGGAGSILVWEPGAHMPLSRKTETWNRNSFVPKNKNKIKLNQWDHVRFIKHFEVLCKYYF